MKNNRASGKNAEPHVYQRLRVFSESGEEMPHQYRMGLHDCVETYHFRSEK